MSTSIITSTTFTIATIIDVQAQVPIVPSPATMSSTVDTIALDANASEEIEITQCMLNSFPRCGLAAKKHCHKPKHP